MGSCKGLESLNDIISGQLTEKMVRKDIDEFIEKIRLVIFKLV